MTGDGTAQSALADRDRTPEPADALDAAVLDVYQRLNAVDAAWSALAIAENSLVSAVERAEAVVNALRDGPIRAEALRRVDELCSIAYQNLAVLAVRPKWKPTHTGDAVRAPGPQADKAGMP